MIKLTISKDGTKCPKCKCLTIKIQHKSGPDKDNFYLENNKLRCAYCGAIFNGAIAESKKTELKLTSQEYKNWENRIDRVRDFKEKNGYYPSEAEIKIIEEEN